MGLGGGGVGGEKEERVEREEGAGSKSWSYLSRSNPGRMDGRATQGRPGSNSNPSRLAAQGCLLLHCPSVRSGRVRSGSGHKKPFGSLGSACSTGLVAVTVARVGPGSRSNASAGPVPRGALGAWARSRFLGGRFAGPVPCSPVRLAALALCSWPSPSLVRLGGPGLRPARV